MLRVDTERSRMYQTQMNLIIVESPTKARTLGRFLDGQGSWRIEATMGHIKDLPKSVLGVDIEKNFAPAYEPVPKKEEVIKKLKEEAKKATMIYLATDPDREGEAIAHHVREILSDKDTKILGKNKNHTISQYHNILISRIVFHEITEDAVKDAINHPRNVDKHLVDAQISRRVLDRLVGYKLSPLLWRKVRRGLSAGRVQTVTVRLIVEREREIEKFKAQEYWEIYCKLKIKNSKLKIGEFVVQLIKIGEKKAEIDNGKDAKEIVNNLRESDYKVLNVDKHEVRKNPYPPFTTSTMTQAGARLFFWSAKKTMSIAQKLYEEGLISYHRTDSVNIAASALEKVRDYIKKSYGDNYLPETPRFYKKTSKLVQEAHEAIRPTDVNSKLKNQNSKFGSDAGKLYDLIWRRFVACQMTAAVYDETTIDVDASFVHSLRFTVHYLLRASGQVMKFDGWRKVVPTKVDSKQGAVQLPEVAKDEKLQLIKVNSQQKFTEPPPRYNEASLIKTLERLGIGRPSTYAPIITTIQVRNYVEKNEGKFFPTPVGVAVNDFLIANFPDVFEYQFTAEMEDDLDKIADGKSSWIDSIKKFWNPFSKKLDSVTKNSKRVKIAVEKLGKKCPTCGKGELVIRIGRFGKFISCSRFPDCKHTEKYVEKVGIKCPKCKKGDVIVKRTSKSLPAGRQGKKFFGCSRFPECKWASWRNPKVSKELPQTTS